MRAVFAGSRLYYYVHFCCGGMSGKKRGLSLEEKRAVVLNLFRESQTIWLLKDMEKARRFFGAFRFLCRRMCS